MSKKNEILKTLNFYANAFPHDQNITAERLEITADALDDCTIEEIKRAFKMGLKDTKDVWRFFPLPFQLLKFIKGNKEIYGVESFNRIMKIIQRIGSNANIDHLADLEKQALRCIGGLRSLGAASQNNLHWLCKDYVKAFEALSTKHELLEEYIAINKPLKELN